MRNHIFLSLCTLLISYAVVAESPSKPASGDGQPRGGHMFERMDANHDGNISPEEHEQGLQRILEKRRAHFSVMDKDGNGLVSKEEARSAHDEMKNKVRTKKNLNKENCQNQ